MMALLFATLLFKKIWSEACASDHIGQYGFAPLFFFEIILADTA